MEYILRKEMGYFGKHSCFSHNSPYVPTNAPIVDKQEYYTIFSIPELKRTQMRGWDINKAEDKGKTYTHSPINLLDILIDNGMAEKSEFDVFELGERFNNLKIYCENITRHQIAIIVSCNTISQYCIIRSPEKIDYMGLSITDLEYTPKGVKLYCKLHLFALIQSKDSAFGEMNIPNYVEFTILVGDSFKIKDSGKVMPSSFHYWFNKCIKLPIGMELPLIYTTFVRLIFIANKKLMLGAFLTLVLGLIKFLLFCAMNRRVPNPEETQEILDSLKFLKEL